MIQAHEFVLVDDPAATLADAYRDRNPMMQFVKLWSCIECFFAITKEKITDANAKRGFRRS